VDSVPFRARKTAKRVAARRRAQSAASAFGSRRSAPPETDDEYVYVDVDPLDPFSPGRSRDAPKWSPSLVSDEDSDAEEWMPFAAVVGIASVMWLLGVLGNAVPSATPSLGM
jgi:hypothetical protein